MPLKVAFVNMTYFFEQRPNAKLFLYFQPCCFLVPTTRFCSRKSITTPMGASSSFTTIPLTHRYYRIIGDVLEVRLMRVSYSTDVHHGVSSPREDRQLCEAQDRWERNLIYG